MEWFFGFDENATGWFSDMIKVAVISATKVEGLEPNCLYDGAPNDLTRWLSANGVRVHFAEVPFKAELSSAPVIERNQGTHYTPSHAAGAFLRTSAAHYAADHSFLYTDCDVMFMDGRIAGRITESFDAVTEHSGSSFNSGVMLINKWYWLAKYDELISFVRENGFYCREHSSFDQVLLNRFFAGEWTHMSPEFNWRPFMGYGPNSDNSIIHFHGPKPHRIGAILDGKAIPEEAGLLEMIKPARKAYQAYLSIYEEFLEAAYA